MNTEGSAFVAACSNNTSSAASSYNKGTALEFRVLLTFYCHEEGIQIQVYDIPFHTTK
jgi:hypothetical protein